MDFDDLGFLKKRCVGKKVLYVEDELHVRNQTRKLLEIYFDNIVEASDGIEGLSEFKKGGIDLVFTDIIMPNMDGIDFLRKIREINPNLPVVIFSACDNTEHFLKAIELGVQGYILKPFSFKEITTVLRKIVHHFDTDSKKLVVLGSGYVWQIKCKTLLKEDKPIKLSRHEIKFLNLLTSSKDQIYSSYDIENFVFDDDLSNNKRVRNLISRLRLKLKIQIVENIYGEGYRLKWQK